MELALAEGVIERLSQPENSFSLIAFGSNPPTLVKTRVAASEAVAAIRGVTLESPREEYFSIYLYEAVKLALVQFANGARSKSVLLISEGNDHFPNKTFKQTVSQSRQQGVAFNVAMVADHPLYGSKRIQKYGFYLRRLAGQTHGDYVEVGGGPKKTVRYVDRLSARIIDQGGTQ